jgi:TrmH family RNA methyltransferase
MAEQALPLLSSNKVAIVFGREVNGLDNEDIALCHELIAIPASDAFPSLNLSHAVMVVAYELFTAAQAKLQPSEHALAPAAELEKFYEHLQKSLVEIEFVDKVHPEHMMFSLRQLFGRARLDSRDVSILRGILSQIERAVKAEKR